MDQRGFWITFGAGAAIGGAIALLYAPNTGTVTRKKLKSNIDDAGDYLEDAGEYLKERAETLTKEAQKAIKLSKEYADSAVEAAGDFTTKSASQVKSLF